MVRKYFLCSLFTLTYDGLDSEGETEKHTGMGRRWWRACNFFFFFLSLARFLSVSSPFNTSSFSLEYVLYLFHWYRNGLYCVRLKISRSRSRSRIRRRKKEKEEVKWENEKKKSRLIYKNNIRIRVRFSLSDALECARTFSDAQGKRLDA